MGTVYIHMSWSGDKPVTALLKKVGDFRQRWLLIGVHSPCAFLDVPEAPPVKNSHWGKSALHGVDNAHRVGRLSFLREEGLTGQMVVADFVTRRIAPL